MGAGTAPGTNKVRWDEGEALELFAYLTGLLGERVTRENTGCGGLYLDRHEVTWIVHDTAPASLPSIPLSKGRPHATGLLHVCVYITGGDSDALIFYKNVITRTYRRYIRFVG